MARLRERSRDGCLAGIQVQQLFCSNNTTIPEHQLKELNIKIDNALQVQCKPQKLGNRTIVFFISADCKFKAKSSVPSNLCFSVSPGLQSSTRESGPQ